MIPVRAEHHRFVFQLRIAALDLRHHIAGVNLANFSGRVSAKPEGQGDGVKPAGVRHLEQLVRRLTDGRGDFIACVFGDPGGQRERGLARRKLHLLILASP